MYFAIRKMFLAPLLHHIYIWNMRPSSYKSVKPLMHILNMCEYVWAGWFYVEHHKKNSYEKDFLQTRVNIDKSEKLYKKLNRKYFVMSFWDLRCADLLTIDGKFVWNVLGSYIHVKEDLFAYKILFFFVKRYIHYSKEIKFTSVS